MSLFRDRFRRNLNLLLGTGLTLFVTGLTLAIELGEGKERYQRFSERLTQHFQDSLGNSSRISKALAGFYNASDRVTIRDFTQFTVFFLQEYPDLSGVAWIERVNRAQKNNFDRSFSARRSSEPSIYRLDDRQKPTAIGNRPEYFPLTYGEPLDQFQGLMGFDLGSQPAYRLLLERTMASENTIVGTPIADRKRKISGFALYHPIYRRGQFTKNAGERRQALVGFVYTEHPWQGIVQQFLDNDNPEPLNFYLVNASGNEQQLLVFYDRQQNRIIDSSEQLQKLQREGDRLRMPFVCRFFLSCQHAIQVADRNWILASIPNRTLLGTPWKTMGAATLGVGITVLATWLGGQSRRKKEELQAACDRKSLELCREKEGFAQQLERQAAELQAAHSANSELLGNISHELRAPLNTISGFIQLLERDAKLSDSQSSALAVISRSGDYLLNLFDGILEIAQIEAGNSTMHRDVFSPIDLVGSAIEMLQPKARAKGVQLNLYVAEETPACVKADEGKLRQILMSLIDNAIKFTDCGSITLRVESANGGWDFEDGAGEDSHPIFLFEVEDTGCGILASEWERVFEPFIRGKNTRDRPFPGMGLGLYIARRLIRLMGGDIRVIESAANRGTLLRFSLPLQLPDPQELPIQFTCKRVVGLAPNQSEFRILIADDRPENRQLFAQLLLPLGFQVREASNGEEAIAIWSDWRPHAIFMDTRMPVMDGFSAIEYIRDRSQQKQTVLIALSSGGMAPKQANWLAIACNEILYRPFSIVTILDKLAKHLGVLYSYEEIEERSPSKNWAQNPPTCTLRPSELAFMPLEWRREVFQAASAGDSQFLLQLIAQIPADRIRLIRELTDLVHYFQFFLLRELTANEPAELSS